ncbi:hypothetical protein U9M48_024828 [Paspalum notatum var. saurae]|uniref:Uncharacterized protein n=1 Tax=Paspalum notatum var. saurae TaxID=547442 RepID=A0AAQ3TPK1_PASNO
MKHRTFSRLHHLAVTKMRRRQPAASAPATSSMDAGGDGIDWEALKWNDDDDWEALTMMAVTATASTSGVDHDDDDDDWPEALLASSEAKH